MTLGPLIVQSDHTVLLEVAHPDAEDARRTLIRQARLLLDALLTPERA